MTAFYATVLTVDYVPRAVMRRNAKGYLEPCMPGEWLTGRQDKEKDPVWARDGPAICITRSARLSDFVFGGRLLPYEMDEATSVDIDDLDDFARAERMLTECHRVRPGTTPTSAVKGK